MKLNVFFKSLIFPTNPELFRGSLEKLLMSSSIARDWLQKLLFLGLKWYGIGYQEFRYSFISTVFHYHWCLQYLERKQLLSPPLTIRTFSVHNVSEPSKRAQVPIRCCPEQVLVDLSREQMPLLCFFALNISSCLVDPVFLNPIFRPLHDPIIFTFPIPSF